MGNQKELTGIGKSNYIRVSSSLIIYRMPTTHTSLVHVLICRGAKQHSIEEASLRTLAHANKGSEMSTHSNETPRDQESPSRHRLGSSAMEKILDVLIGDSPHIEERCK